ncbi:Endoplasmic reticulum metallopeptidase 1-like [Oopsacas minuta]|uniref:Endoplasmic reticulum metallopeptidase 1-like n=1 Tax=Oopsacas minuta TaxID=111878 RepID=A0AAV7KE31_9METZ|nr:Endoplasmic reticulum metallopeptidase 1-like [Oopsacas minuta]
MREKSDLKYSKIRLKREMVSPYELKQSCILLLFLIGYHVTVFLTVYYFLFKLPTVTDDGKNRDFSVKQARYYLENITSYGVRQVGSKSNEEQTPQYLTQALNQIMNNSKELAYEIEVTRNSGNFLLNILTKKPWVNIYKNVGSVVIRVHKKSIRTKHSLLINAHYDSALDSPAASDDAVSCAIMLEVLNSIVGEVDSGKYDFDTELIMLFNGAEETFLQASHGFSTQHPWVKNLKGFVNLEAAGSGGREILFQAGPNNPWIVEEYVKSVPYPFGASLADDVFKSGIIPSDTDYKIFRDFAHIPGLDIAYCTNGYIYHTTYDKSEYIPDGSILRGGLNTLSLTKALLNSEGLKLPLDNIHGTPVYFDVLGLYTISVSKESNTLISTAFVIIVLIYTILNQTVMESVKGFVHVLISYLCGCLAPLCIAGEFTVSGRGCMSWFSHQWIVIILYAIPAFTGASIYHIFNSPADSKAIVKREKQLFIGTMLVWICLLIFLSYHDKSTSFLACLWIAGPFISRGIIGEFVFPSLNSGFNIIKAYTLTAVGVLLVLCLSIYATVTFIDVIIPITSRMGNRIPSELMIAGLVSMSTLLLTSYFIPLTMYIHKSIFKMVTLLSTLVTVIFFLLAITQTIFPYSMKPGSPKPKRLFVSYVSTENQGSMPDNYLWIIPGDWLDINPILNTKRTLLDESILVECDGLKNVITDCPLTTFAPLYSKLSNTYYIKINENNDVPEPVLEKINSTEYGGKVKIGFSVQINYRGVMLMAMRESVEMINWSFAGEPTQISLNDGTLIFFFHLSCGFDPCLNEFWLEFEGFEKDKVNIDIGVGNQWTNEESKILKDFRNDMPEWVDILTWQTNYKTWKF